MVVVVQEFVAAFLRPRVLRRCVLRHRFLREANLVGLHRLELTPPGFIPEKKYVKRRE
jgi:hypothetical protein